MNRRIEKPPFRGDRQFIEADKRSRRIVLASFGLSICIVALLIHWALPWATNYLLQLEPQKSLRILQIVISVIFLSVLPMAWYVYTLGQKVVTSKQMPPPGTKLIKKTRVIEGRQAVLRGKVLIVVALLLAVLSLVGGTWFPFRLEKMIAERTERDPNTISAVDVL